MQYLYKHKKTGEKIITSNKLKKHWELIKELGKDKKVNTQLKSNKITKK